MNHSLYLKCCAMAPVILFAALVSIMGGARAGNMMDVTVQGVLEDAPECTVNGNNEIDVDFGDEVYSSRIDGISYKKTAIITSLICNDNLLSTALKLAVISTSGDGYEPGLIATNVDGLAIKLFMVNTPIDTGEFVNFTYDSSSVPALYAVPVKQYNASLKPGEFVGAGTLVIAYQ